MIKITAKQYAKTLLSLTDEKSEQEVLDVIKKFSQKLRSDGQVKNVAKVVVKFSELYDEKYGIVSADVTSREELGKVAIAEITEYIKKKYNANTVEIKNIINKEIKGGIVIRVGDEIMDGSISAQLKKLKNILSK